MKKAVMYVSSRACSVVQPCLFAADINIPLGVARLGFEVFAHVDKLKSATTAHKKCGRKETETEAETEELQCRRF